MEYTYALLRAVMALLVAFGVTWRLLPVVIGIARKFDIVDKPDGKLKQHGQATPYLGGLAVYSGCLTALALFLPIHNTLFFLCAGSSLIFIVGLIDDLWVLTPGQKWWGQVIVALCFMRGGFYLKELFLASGVSPLIAYCLKALSFFWITLIMNALNLLDIMDGLASCVGLILAIQLTIFALITGADKSLLILAVLIGALSAFLCWNRPPARIYLGDAGSLFIGSILAVIPFTIPWSFYTSYGLFTPIALFCIPLLEIGGLIFIRTYRHIPFYQGSPDHFALYLKRQGYSVEHILFFVVAFSFFPCIVGLLFFQGSISLTAFVCGGICTLALWIALIFRPIECFRRKFCP